MSRLTIALALGAALWAHVPLHAGAQETQASTPVAGAKAAAARAAAVKAKTATATEASAVATAAAKAGADAETAATAVEELDKILAQADATLDAVTSAVKKAADAARSAADAAGAAAKAAAAALPKVPSDEGRLRADRAADKAKAAAGDADAAATAAGKASASAKDARDTEAARKAGRTVSTETGKAVRAATEAAIGSAEVAEQAADPDLPLLADSDRDILSALRVRLTGGAIFFNGEPQIVRTTSATGVTTGRPESAQFKQAATYLALESQPRLIAGEWRLWSPGKAGCHEDCARVRRLAVTERGFHRVYAESLVSARLTTIPVATIATVQAPGEDFLKSAKAAQAQFGGLLTFNYGWGHPKLHWGIGPSARFMFQNVTDGDRSVRVWNPEDDLFNSKVFGGRLVLYQKGGTVGDTPHEGWAPVAYLDVSRGEFQNFEKATAKPGKDDAAACLLRPLECLGGTPPPKEDYDIDKSHRFLIEARLMLRYVYLGLDINNGSGSDDMRFIGGLTVKLDNFMRRQ